MKWVERDIVGDWGARGWSNDWKRSKRTLIEPHYGVEKARQTIGQEWIMRVPGVGTSTGTGDTVEL